MCWLYKLPGLPWAKYSGEKHLFNHSFTGPETRLDLQLNSDDTPITKPINRVDAAAYKHDLVYRDHVHKNCQAFIPVITKVIYFAFELLVLYFNN